MTQTTATKVLHNQDCKRVFKNYDLSCARCLELKGGAEARSAWFEPRKAYKPSASCGHNNLNPGGYCMTCGNGRDFS